MIHPTAIIHDNVVLGDGVSIGAYSVIGSPAECKYGDNNKSVGRVYIGDKTIIREHVTIHSPEHEDGETFIGNQCYIQAHSHIGHDSELGDHVTIATHACVGGYNKLHKYVNIALHAVTHQRTTVNQGTMLGAGAFGKGVLEPWSIYVGVPAKRIKPNKYLIDRLGIKI